MPGGHTAPAPEPVPLGGATAVRKTLVNKVHRKEDDEHPAPPSWPPRFGDGNTEPGGHLECCCPGVRISYCKLSQQVVLATLVAVFIGVTLASAIF
ncbi:unnamed protein product [Ectocarpus sp. 8 AP-2014]